MEWLFIALYAGVALVLLRPLAGHFAWTFRANDEMEYLLRRPRPNGEQWFGATLLATLLSAAWPLLVAWLLSGVYLPKVGSEKRAIVKQQRERIAELEKELGL